MEAYRKLGKLTLFYSLGAIVLQTAVVGIQRNFLTSLGGYIMLLSVGIPFLLLFSLRLSIFKQLGRNVTPYEEAIVIGASLFPGLNFFTFVAGGAGWFYGFVNREKDPYDKLIMKRFFLKWGIVGVLIFTYSVVLALITDFIGMTVGFVLAAVIGLVPVVKVKSQTTLRTDKPPQQIRKELTSIHHPFLNLYRPHARNAQQGQNSIQLNYLRMGLWKGKATMNWRETQDGIEIQTYINGNKKTDTFTEIKNVYNQMVVEREERPVKISVFGLIDRYTYLHTLRKSFEMSGYTIRNYDNQISF